MISGYAIATLVVYIISNFFIVHPISIPTPRPLPRIPINLSTAPILAIALLWAAQCLDPAVIRNGIIGTEGVKPYNILILLFSLAYMAITLDVTGVLQAAAFWVRNKGGHNGWRLYLYFYLMFTLLSILLGNDPIIISGTAFLTYYTSVCQLDPRAWVMAEFAAVNTASMVLFVGNPTNVVICESFGISDAAFTAYTILPFLACSLLCFVALAFQYRNQVPRRLIEATFLDPRSALRDPVGASVGSFMLGTTLILCLVANLFGADVWMISLPFAVSKLLFDLGWDHYRFTRGIPMLGLLGRDLPETVEEVFSEDSTAVKHRSAAKTLSYSPSVGEKHQRAEDIPPSYPLSTKEEHQRAEDTPPSYPLSNEEEQQRAEDTPPSYPLSTEEEHQRVEDTPSSYSSSTEEEHRCVDETPSSYSSSTGEGQPQPPQHDGEVTNNSHSKSWMISFRITPHLPRLPSLRVDVRTRSVIQWCRSKMNALHAYPGQHFPTFVTTLPRLPFALVLFAFSQFILIEALDHQGWVKTFATLLVRASHNQLHTSIWLVGITSVIMCNCSSTNFGATILLAKVIRAAALPYDANRGAAIALAVAANIGAVSFTFSASLSGLLWRNILAQKGIYVRQRDFAFWNFLPLLVMMTVGFGIVSAEMAVLFQS